MVSGSLFLALFKAFDLVNHNFLINKLQLYNIDTPWFSSYLQNRFQQTYFSGAMSNQKAVISGVPQGSVLGPILFLIYINDLPLSLTKTCADIVTDDTTLRASHEYVENVVQSLTTDLQNVLSWCNVNCMTLSISKIKVHDVHFI